jgi:hypothetical protein
MKEIRFHFEVQIKVVIESGQSKRQILIYEGVSSLPRIWCERNAT